jgi:signal transduction histidine kinase
LSLRARLLLYGAVLPTLALLLSFGVAAGVFQARLLNHVDEALMGQAAVESVSLFDRATPHLHAEDSPIAGARGFAAAGAIYDPAGTRVTQTARRGADDSAFPERFSAIDGTGIDAAPHLSTVHDTWRQLSVPVPAPDGRVYHLLLRAPLAEHRRTVRTFYAVTGTVVVLVGLMLLAVQRRHALRLEGRVRRLAEHMLRVRDGHLGAPPPEDHHPDVIGQLSLDIRDATERLAEARDARARLVADAAHELRTPLAAIKANIDVTLRRARSNAELVESLEETRGEVERLSVLSARLLDLARLDRTPLDGDTVALAPGDLRRVAEAAMDAARGSAAAADVDLVLRGPPEARALIDAEALRQALDNLLSNAVRHGPAGSRVELRLARRPADAGPGWRLTVTDAGPGVPADQRSAVFAPFARFDRSHGGAGLGLAIVHTVARQHGGAAWVEAGPGGVFVLDLPSAASAV